MQKNSTECLKCNAFKSTKLSIDRFPNKVLHHLMKFVPKKDRKQLARVCKRFHQIVRMYYKVVFFNYQQFKNHSTFKSILSSPRRFKKLKLSVTKRTLRNLSTFLEIHGNSIESLFLEVSSDKLIEGDFWVSILRKVPNVVKLCLKFEIVDISHCDIKEEVILPKIKHLKIYQSSKFYSIGNFLNFLPKNELKSLEIGGKFSQDFITFIANQTESIEDLKLNEKFLMTPELFENIKLKSLCVFISNSFDITYDLLPVIKKHPELERIEVIHEEKSVCMFEAKGEFLKILLAMKNLKSIKIEVNHENWTEVLKEIETCKIPKIHLCLESLFSGNMRFFLNRHFNNSITSLSIRHSNRLDIYLCQYWKQLTKINFCGGDQILNLNLILENLPNLISIGWSMQEVAFIYNRKVFQNIQSISFDKITTHVEDLLNALPNLNKIAARIPFNIDILEIIASMSLNSINVTFEGEEFMATEEVMILFDQIFRKVKEIRVIFNTQKYSSFNVSMKTQFDDCDYIHGPVIISDYFIMLKLERSVCTSEEFPFNF